MPRAEWPASATALRRLALLTALGACVPGSAAPADAPSEANSARPAETPATRGTPGTAGTAATSRRFTFRQLGATTPMQLRGVHNYVTLPFAVRADEVVARAVLHLDYSWSPSLLEDISHLNVLVNDEVAATLTLPRAQAGTIVKADIEIPAQLMAGYNRLAVELVAHYARGCEDPQHSSLWASVSNTSALDLQVTRLPQLDELRQLPLPFFDRRDAAELKLPMVFSQEPDVEALKSAGILASWFGGLAGYRGARFSSIVGSLPATGTAVVMAVGDEALARLGVMPPGGRLTGATVAVVAHPNDPMSTLLLVMGRDTAEMRTAALSIALGSKLLAGQSVDVSRFEAPAARQPYDAPNWLSATRPVRFAELAQPDTLGVAGESPDLVRVAFEVPPDLFGWRSAGIPVDLKYRYSPRKVADRSSLNVNINQRFLQAMPLTTEPPRSGSVMRSALAAVLPGMPGAAAGSGSEARFFVPLFTLPVHNQLQLHYYYDQPKIDTCQAAAPDNVRGGIDPDSTLDISGFSHFLAMPDLAAFANSGFPFTRMADLSETAVVMPEHMDDGDRGAFLVLMGRMGAATGYPAHRVSLLQAGQVDAMPDKDLLVLGDAARQPLLRRWAADLPVSLVGGQREMRFTDSLYAAVGQQRSDSRMAFSSNGKDGVLMGFESPLKAGRSVVMVSGGQPGGVGSVIDVLLDPQLLKKLQGAAALVRMGDVESFSGSHEYQVGKLPPLTWARWFFSQHPLPLASLAFAAAALFGAVLYRSLSARAAHRLRNG